MMPGGKRRARPLALVTAAAATALGCGDSGPGATAGSDGCRAAAVATAALCAGAAGPCAARRAMTFTCPHAIDDFDLAVAPDGRAFAALSSTPRRQVTMLALDAAGMARASLLEDEERALVAVGPTGDPVVLPRTTAKAPRLYRRTAAGDWAGAPIELAGYPVALGANQRGEALVLGTRSRGPSTDLVLDRFPGPAAPMVIENQSDWPLRLLVNGGGEANVFSLEAGSRRLVVHTVSLGAFQRWITLPALEEPHFSAALTGSGGALVVWRVGGNLWLSDPAQSQSARRLFAVTAPEPPACGGLAVRPPDGVCQGTLFEGDGGEQASHAYAVVGGAAGAFFVALTRPVQLTCRRAPAACADATCHCRDTLEEERRGPWRLRIGRTDGSAPDIVLDAQALSIPDQPLLVAAADGQGLLHIAQVEGTPSLVVVDPLAR